MTGLGLLARRSDNSVRRRVLRWFVRRQLLEEPVADEMLAWDYAGGFSLDARVRIEADDRAGSKRFLRYGARPPFALERLQWQGSGQGEEGVLLHHLPRPRPDGRTVHRLSQLKFLGRLGALIPLGRPAGPELPPLPARLPALRRDHAADRLLHASLLRPSPSGTC